MIVVSPDGRELTALLGRLPSTGRPLLGISGAPGAGKSTLAAWLATHHGAAVVPMDGFHLSGTELSRRGLLDVKGAPETFDAEGYADLLTCIAAGEPVRAPAFEHRVGEPAAEAIDVPAQASLVVTEGNYLLLPEDPWPAARAALDDVWHVVVDDHLRRERLLARSLASGRTAAAARDWVDRVDESNARRVAAAAASAGPDAVVDLTEWRPSAGRTG